MGGRLFAAMSSQFSRRQMFKTLPLAALGNGLQIQVRSQDAKKLWVTGNPAIDKPREIALGLLKPTQAQIEHAWELHFGSVVFESYGFAPRCAIDAEAMNEAIAGGASAAELSDLRESMTMSRNATNERERKEFLEAFRAAGVTCIFQNTGEEGSDPMRLIKRLAHFTKATDLMRPELSKVVTAEEVLALKKAGQVGLCFTTNGVPLMMDWESVRDELRWVRLFHELGTRMMHLTYNRRNPIGDGAGEPHDGGLSDFGHATVAEMNRIGVIVDVAHSGWKTALDAAKASTKPMVASHTTCASLYEHFRGKPDETIKAICDTGGLVGMCCIPRFLGGKGDVLALMDHLDYLIRRFGAEHAAIGCDVAYTSRFDKEERAKLLKAPSGSAERWEHLWPKDDYVTTLEAEQSLAWSNWPLFTLGMIMRGHGDEAIRQVIGGNMLRVLKANEV
ncbi:MAG: membrane dipeptidase [Verrucomicrobiaceae bacterium]|nr:membrane dipeptidase [Verrucomicrobiaceae bacterium]